MMDFGTMVRNMVNVMTRPLVPDDGDYQQDGLWHCGNCKTPRQIVVTMGDEQMPVTQLCKCREAEQDASEAQDKARKQAQRREKLRGIAFEDANWAVCTFDADDKADAAASEICRRYAEHIEAMMEANMGLMLYGGVGSGKTFLAACIGNAAIDKGYSVRMASLPTLIAEMGLGEEHEESMREIMTADLLILDDVGVERDTAYSLEQSYEIINARYKAGKPLIITTNLTMGDIKGETQLSRRRTMDRIIELCKPVKVTGESRRPGIARQKYAAAIRILEGAE